MGFKKKEPPPLVWRQTGFRLLDVLGSTDLFRIERASILYCQSKRQLYCLMRARRAQVNGEVYTHTYAEYLSPDQLKALLQAFHELRQQLAAAIDQANATSINNAKFHRQMHVLAQSPLIYGQKWLGFSGGQRTKYLRFMAGTKKRLPAEMVAVMKPAIWKLYELLEQIPDIPDDKEKTV